MCNAFGQKLLLSCLLNFHMPNLFYLQKIICCKLMSDMHLKLKFYDKDSTIVYKADLALVQTKA